MTIDEAIQYLEKMHPYMKITWGTLGQDSIKLGIEGLKAVKENRRVRKDRSCPMLPGETKE